MSLERLAMRNWVVVLFLTIGHIGLASAQEGNRYLGTLDDFKAYIAKWHHSGWFAPDKMTTVQVGDTSLRYARWNAAGPSVQGTVVYFSGRTEFIERNTRTYSDLAKK